MEKIFGDSNQLMPDAITVITRELGVSREEVTDITALKRGMTNRSFRFSCRGKKYIIRVPGEGTGKLINRAQEAAVYHTIAEKNIGDDIVYIDPREGYKITLFLERARVCNPNNADDVEKCMKRLREFHELGLKVDHEFNIFRQIDFYESLWNGAPSAYKDYEEVKERVFSLQPYINAHIDRKVLAHIDAVPDNFLFVGNEAGEEEIRLIDWEYAGMQDPHVDIAMFCIYALYDREQVDRLIEAYFPEGCPAEIHTKIYCYIAACGLLWSNWCEYKRKLGIEFGEYALRQYDYAREYCRLAQEEQKEQEGADHV
ncbi:MAG: phosphotransferase family protein [Lachnospiraceae bacterium]|nr:phosphotransferase family protein [Lachnospiraceae bacterium]